MVKARTAPCPRCGERAILDTSNPWRPFCSERCQMVDLGKWATGEYAIPAEEETQSSDSPEDPAQRRH